MANALTAVRLLLVLPFAFFMAKADRRSAIFALVAWLLALITDLLDGPIARRRGTVTAFERNLRSHHRFSIRHFRIICGSPAGRVPVDTAHPDHAGLCPVCDRFLLGSPARQTSREQARPLQWHALLRSIHPGHSHPNGTSLSTALAHLPGLVAGPDHAAIHGSAADVHETTRTAPEWPAGEIAGPPRR